LRILLDTHAWYWSLASPERLSKRARKAIERSENSLWLSPVSVWEVLLLAERGRLKLDADPRLWAREALLLTPAQEAPLTHEVALRSREVALPHEDPADRFLVATALCYDLTLATADKVLIEARPCPILVAR
jgi:PIN domain nuclease of toxin-antitoxin system